MDIAVEKLGRREYSPTWEYQRSLFEKRLNNEIPDTLLLVEHDPVYTIGKTGIDLNVIVSETLLERTKTPVIHIDRGGDITFHGPGQIVGYPILRLENYYRDVHRYLRDIEAVIIRTLKDYDICACREPGLTGVWVNGEKVAAIGVKVSRWITMHGFALNVLTDLKYFDNIVPCGIKDRRVTSMSRILGRDISMEQVMESLVKHFREIFKLVESNIVENAGVF